MIGVVVMMGIVSDPAEVHACGRRLRDEYAKKDTVSRDYVSAKKIALTAMSATYSEIETQTESVKGCQYERGLPQEFNQKASILDQQIGF